MANMTTIASRDETPIMAASSSNALILARDFEQNRFHPANVGARSNSAANAIDTPDQNAKQGIVAKVNCGVNVSTGEQVGIDGASSFSYQVENKAQNEERFKQALAAIEQVKKVG